MSHCEYLVFRRSGQWWVTIDGARRGPYVSQKVAIDSAIHAAKLDFREGRTARVSVDEPGKSIEVAFETGSPR